MDVYFDKIKDIILKEIDNATSDIKIAIAWLNDPALFEIICRKSDEGISIELITMNDKLNNCSGTKFQDFIDKSCSALYLVSPNKLMHHKFAIIDNKKVITGSYNWTRGARNNDENIIIFDDTVSIKKYTNEFNRIKAISEPKITDYKSNKIIDHDTTKGDFIAEIPADEIFEYKRIPFEIGIKTQNCDFYPAIDVGEKLPITKHLLEGLRTIAPQSGFNIEVRKRDLIGPPSKLMDIHLSFSKHEDKNVPKADVYFSVDENGKMLVEVEEINGSNRNIGRYDLINGKLIIE